MRITVKIDSATAEEARQFIIAFQRTRRDLDTDADNCTVEMIGTGWGVTTAPLDPHHALTLCQEYGAWRERVALDNLNNLYEKLK